MAAANQYEQGDRPKIGTTFRNFDGDPTNPDDVTAIVRKPDGSEITETGTVAAPGALGNPGVGVWEYIVPSLDQPGIWHWRFEGTGAVDAATDTWFLVKRKPVAVTS